MIERLAAANPFPVVPELPDDVVAAAVAEIVAVPRPRRRRPRRRTALLAALAVLVAMPSGAAAIELAGIHTGFFPSAGDTESTPGQEYLDVGAPGIVAVVRELTGGYPLPPGADWAPLLARWPSREGGLMQRSGIGIEVEWYARCRWQAAWLRAHRTGDAAADAATADVLRRAARWPFTVESDRGGGLVAGELKTAAAAAAGNAARVRTDYAANC